MPPKGTRNGTMIRNGGKEYASQRLATSCGKTVTRSPGLWRQWTTKGEGIGTRLFRRKMNDANAAVNEW